MMYGLLADLTILLHVAFVVFVVVGGLLVWQVPKIAWVHLPVVIWGVVVEWSGAICPLTPLENWLHQRAGQTTYRGGFIDYYVVPFLYPDALTRELQIGLGSAVLVLNTIVYACWWFSRR